MGGGRATGGGAAVERKKTPGRWRRRRVLGVFLFAFQNGVPHHAPDATAAQTTCNNNIGVDDDDDDDDDADDALTPTPTPRRRQSMVRPSGCVSIRAGRRGASRRPSPLGHTRLLSLSLSHTLGASRGRDAHTTPVQARATGRRDVVVGDQRRRRRLHRCIDDRRLADAPRSAASAAAPRPPGRSKFKTRRRRDARHRCATDAPRQFLFSFPTRVCVGSSPALKQSPVDRYNRHISFQKTRLNPLKPAKTQHHPVKLVHTRLNPAKC